MKKILFVLYLLSANIANAQDFVALAEKSLPKVVSITSRIENKEVIGSGFIIDETGLIVTNNHVVDGAYHIEVLVNEAQKFKATIKGKDKLLDIALIKIDPYELLPYITFANSDNTKIGQWTMAVGNPYGLGNSISVGVISAKSREIGNSPYDNYIQTDAAINMGNSGGPLFDLQGNVIGMTTAIFSQSQNGSGVGFALPSNQIKSIVEELKKHGEIKRGWIGLSISQFSDGVKISEINENSPAYNKGLRVGDIIKEINGKKIKKSTEVSNIIMHIKPADNIIIKTNNNTYNIDVIAKPAKLQNQTSIKSCQILDMDISSSNLSINNVQNNSDAFIKGIKQGDVIKALDNNIVLTCQDIKAHIIEANRSKKESIMAKIITKDGNTHFVELQI